MGETPEGRRRWRRPREVLVGRIKAVVDVEEVDRDPAKVTGCRKAAVALTGKFSQNYETWEPSQGMGDP